MISHGSQLCFANSVLVLPARARSFPHIKTSRFCPRLRHSRKPIPQSLPARITPTSHSTCHSHCHHHETPAPSADSSPSPLTAITNLQHNTRAAALAGLLFIAAAILYLLRLPILLIRIPLIACLSLTAVPALISSLDRLVRTRARSIDVEILMNIAIGICVGTGALFEGALLSTLYAVSHAAEDFVSRSARKALDDLRDVTPNEALKLSSPQSTSPSTIPISEVAVGDFLLVRGGEIIPCDGVIVSGCAFVSMQHITGEPSPRTKSEGEYVPAGGRTEDAPLVIEVTRVGAESSLARITRLVTAAQEHRPKVTRFFDKFGERYATSVLVISSLIAVSLPMISIWLAPIIPAIPYVGRTGSITRALGFLVAASPCALMIGAPVAYLAALSSCAKRGVLAKSGAKSLEAASRAAHIVFDKTGTLTTGKLKLTGASVLPADADIKEHGGRVPRKLEELRELEAPEMTSVISAAAALESGAVHPIATAVRKKAVEMGGALPEVSNVHLVAGQGVEGVVSYEADGDMVMTQGRLGRPSYILEKGVVRSFGSLTEEASLKGETVSVFDFGDVRYLLRLRDEIRDESKDVVQHLTEAGYEVSVLTGDAEGAARLVSNTVGVGATVVSNATPEDKLQFVKDLGEKLAQNNKGVLMVGDGVNDAAALAASLIGVACGLSSATAVHAADVVLMRDDLTNIGWFLKKAKATEVIVRQNLVLALGLMVLATLACIGGSIPLWLAVTMHEGGTVLVGLNGLRLLRDS